MQNSNDNTSLPKDSFQTFSDQAEITLTDIAVPVWRKRNYVIVMTLAITTLFLLFAKYTERYESYGFFQFGGPIPLKAGRDTQFFGAKNKQTSDENRYTTVTVHELTYPMDRAAGKKNPLKMNGMSLSDYKQFSAKFMTHDRLNEYVQDRGLTKNPSASSLLTSFRYENAPAQILTPVYTFSKLDARDLVGNPDGESNHIIGLKISYSTGSPERAKEAVSIMGKYVMDSITYQIYSTDLRSKASDIANQIRQLENKIIQSELSVNMHEQKVADLKKVISKHQLTEQQKKNQDVYVSIAMDPSYLSPGVQLVANEVKILNQREDILKHERQQKALEIMLNFYSKNANSVLNQTKSGEELLDQLDARKEEMFKDLDKKDNTVRQVYNSITNEIHIAKNLYFQKSDFAAGPTLPTISTFRPVKNALIGAIAGLILSVLSVLVHSWWMKNKSKMV